MMWPTPDDDPGSWTARHVEPPDSDDMRLAALVVEELITDVRIRGLPIGIEVQNNVVVLTGTVDTQATRELVSCAVRGVPGVADVCNTLRVADPHRRYSGEPAIPSDDEVFQQIVTPLTSRDGAGRTLPALVGLTLWVVLTLSAIYLNWVWGWHLPS